MNKRSVYDNFIKENGKTYISKKDLDLLILEGVTYRHFKNKMYIVEKVAFNAVPEVNDLSRIPVIKINVIYTALYGDKITYTRPLMDFIADVSEREDNVTGQKHRFEVYIRS